MFANPPETYGFPPEAFDHSGLPDVETDFTLEEDFEAFARALQAPDPLQSPVQTPLQSPPVPAEHSHGSLHDVSHLPGPRRGHHHGGADVNEAAAVAASAAAAGGTPTVMAPGTFFSARSDWSPVNMRVVPRNSGDNNDKSNNKKNRKSNSKKRRGRADRAARTILGTRTKDETREGYLYALFKWPLLALVGAWLAGLATAYTVVRVYIWAYEHYFTWRGRREQLRRNMRRAGSYEAWVAAARELDTYLGRRAWKEENRFAYYDSGTVRRVWEQMRRARLALTGAGAADTTGEDTMVRDRIGDDKIGEDKAGEDKTGEDKTGGNKTEPGGIKENGRKGDGEGDNRKADSYGNMKWDMKGDGKVYGKEESRQDKAAAAAAEDLVALLDACVKSDFVGLENPRLYSQTYHGTKNLVEKFFDEAEKSLHLVLSSPLVPRPDKRRLFGRLRANYGRTALCLSGGASFAFFHLGVVRALLDADLLPSVIAGTSGGAVVAALVATRTDDELRRLLVPALAHRIDICREPPITWLPRWWRTGARFDSVDWARRASWWCRGSTTFREAFVRTGRILNVTCVPADPHSPTMLCNHLTSPDCVIWSAVLASAAVPGVLNPVVLMAKRPLDGRLVPYSFGHKWKDGSLRTDVPVRALNLHFNVNFTIVSQVNPHINLFFFAPRGGVGAPVTHRKGRGWRGGYLMSALEHYLKLDMNKWLRFVRHAELLPRPLDQDWSQLWLQTFNGNVTLWPRSRLSDFFHILSDPDPPRLARMLHEGRQSAFPVLKFVDNRLKVERLVERGWKETRGGGTGGTGGGAATTTAANDSIDDSFDGLERLDSSLATLATLAGHDRSFDHSDRSSSSPHPSFSSSFSSSADHDHPSSGIGTGPEFATATATAATAGNAIVTEPEEEEEEDDDDDSYFTGAKDASNGLAPEDEDAKTELLGN